MNQNIWARRLRPQSFEEVLGQEAVLSTLRHLLQHQSFHPALLLHGMRGVGKTSLARIIAKSLNCETGITPVPCQNCWSCQAIRRGEHADVIELDAASRTKVEEIREWLETLPYAPTLGRMKVFILDEAHMLSRHSFNALLKMLEEPPQHVQFIFATTEPHKLPDTVRSRTLSLALKPLDFELLTQHLAAILRQEGLEAPPEFCASIALASQGSLRDALNLMEQAVAQQLGQKGTLRDAALTPNLAWPQELWQWWEAEDWGRAWKSLASHVQSVDDADEVMQGWQAILTSAYLKKSFKALGYLPTTDEDFPLSLDAFPVTQKLSLKTLWQMQQAVVALRQELPWSHSPRSAVQLLWVRLSHFRRLESPLSPSTPPPSSPSTLSSSPSTPTPPALPLKPSHPKSEERTQDSCEGLALRLAAQLPGMAKSLLLQSQPSELVPSQVEGEVWKWPWEVPVALSVYLTDQVQQSLEVAAAQLLNASVAFQFTYSSSPLKPLVECFQQARAAQRDHYQAQLEGASWKALMDHEVQTAWVGFTESQVPLPQVCLE